MCSDLNGGDWLRFTATDLAHVWVIDSPRTESARTRR